MIRSTALSFRIKFDVPGLQKLLKRAKTFDDKEDKSTANARRSQVAEVIAECIVGHSREMLTVNETYEDISEEELLEAIESMTFDKGSTRVLGRRYDLEEREEEGHVLEKV